jgi:methionyl-tRNA formyltransferase
MGTPAFAVPSLQAVINAGHEVTAVYCQPDKPSGRGMKLMPCPVKQLALSLDIPVFQPIKIRDGTVKRQWGELIPDAAAVVAYGKLLPPDILCIPKYGCINVHASLLPKYRGAAPIQWAIINGEKKSGVTTMHMAEGMDTGDMIFSSETEIPAGMTAGGLHDVLTVTGGDLLVKTLDAVANGTAPRTPQNDAEATLAPMLDKSMAVIDWSLTANEIACRIRGLDPWPAAEMNFSGIRLRLFGANVSEIPAAEVPGTARLEQENLIVSAGDKKAVCIQKVQAPGGKILTAADFFRGAGRGLIP